MGYMSEKPQENLFLDLEHMALQNDGLVDILDKRLAVGFSPNFSCEPKEQIILKRTAAILSNHALLSAQEQEEGNRFAYRGLVVRSIIGARILGQDNWGLDESVFTYSVQPTAEDLMDLGNRYLAQRPVLHDFASKYAGTACPGIKAPSMREVAYDGIGVALKLTEDYHIGRLCEQTFDQLIAESPLDKS